MAPVTCGVAIEVPLIVFVAVSLVFQAEVIELPGAKRSRHVPKLENEALASVLVVAPIVFAAATRAGEVVHASALELPAAIAYETPELIEVLTAVSSDVLAPPPRLMFATDGATWFEVTQSTPAITPEFVPEPWQLRTRTACKVTDLATPYVVPPVGPPTCVPWPLQSFVPFPSPTKSAPLPTRPVNCWCEARRPVSMM